MEFAWDEIIGHQVNIRKLQRLVAEDRLPHALLFYGPEGVGKLRVARALAASILCRGGGRRPCGRCDSCLALRRETHPDYFEIRPQSRTEKGARAIRIDEVRQLETLISLRPKLSSRHVVVIDDAHLMNEAAQNSLLKTLEEPTGRMDFILVTSERSALLDTIRSRCMGMGFGMLEEPLLVKTLEARGIPEAAELASLSDGSLGRALTLYADDGLSLRQEALAFLSARTRLSVERIFARGAEMGKYPRQKLVEWFSYLNMLLRDLCVLHEDGGSPLLYHKDLRQELAALLPDYPERRLFSLLSLVREAQERLRSTASAELITEQFFLRAREA